MLLYALLCFMSSLEQQEMMLALCITGFCFAEAGKNGIQEFCIRIEGKSKGVDKSDYTLRSFATFSCGRRMIIFRALCRFLKELKRYKGLFFSMRNTFLGKSTLQLNISI